MNLTFTDTGFLLQNMILFAVNICVKCVHFVNSVLEIKIDVCIFILLYNYNLKFNGNSIVNIV